MPNLEDLFLKIYQQLNPEDIKKSVDEKGIDKFISRCATYAAISGGVNGAGGFTTMIVGVPADVINNIVQQFRVTLGVIYYKRKVYKVAFDDFMKIVGVSVGVEVGATVTKATMIAIANQMLKLMAASTAGKAFPVLGAFIGGSVNYTYITAIGAAVKKVT